MTRYVHYACKIAKSGEKLLIIIPKHLHNEVRKLGEYVEVVIAPYGAGPRPPPILRKNKNGKVLCVYPPDSVEREELVLNTGVEEKEVPHLSSNPKETLMAILVAARQALDDNNMEKARKLITTTIKLLTVCF